MRFCKLGFVFFILHVGTVFLVFKQDYEGSWGGFFLFILDMPASLLILLPLHWNQWIFFGIFGSLWWYGIGFLISIIKRKKITD
jgi:hypothetical protein